MKPNKAIDCEKRSIPGFRPHAWLLGLVTLWVLTVQAVPPPAGLAPVLSPPGGLAIDGDLLANTPTADTGDWLAGVGGTGGAVLDANGTPLNPATTFHFVDPYNADNDETFSGGLKWTDDPNTWEWTTGKASGKTDINNVLLHVTTDAEGHTWLIAAADRLSTSGESYIDFEFLQNPLTRGSDGTFKSAGPNGGRTTNDVLLSLAFTDGGSVADFYAYRWIRSGSGFAYVDATAALPTGRVFVAANSTNAAVPYGAFGQTNYTANAYAEAALDLTALLGGFDPCLSIGVKTIMVKTKTSTSSSASIVDFIAPIQYNIQIGPSADAGADQARCTEGDSTAFLLQGQATRGLYPIVSTNWSVVSGAVTIDATDTLITTAHVYSTTATLRLTVAQANGCIETDDVVLTVKPLPVASITGPTLVCPQSSAQFEGPAGMGSYAWAITGNGTIFGPADTRAVTVIAGPECGTNFSLSLVVASNSCLGDATTTDVIVNDTVAPLISSIPADVTLQCASAVPTPDDGAVIATDNCNGAPVITHSDETLPGPCVNQFVIKRTYTATDVCGNSSSQTQTITVHDDIAPVIASIPADITLQCASAVPAPDDGAVIATDNCSGAVVITHSDQTKPGSCVNKFVIKRTYTATDVCGNSSSQTQTITVDDNTAPVISGIPADVTLQCASAVPEPNDAAVVGTDNCDGALVITHSDETIPGSCVNQFVIKRTYTATDVCGNSSSQTQTITVHDDTAPVISGIPADVTVQCASAVPTPDDGAVIATDNCNGTLGITHRDQTIAGSCANQFVIKRTYTATDVCGNSSSQTQTITVHDDTAPVISGIPADVTLQCASAVPAPDDGAVIATDNCSGSVVITHTDQTIPGSCVNQFVIKRTYTATDVCGNSSSQTQTITVHDNIPPMITLPPDVTEECPGDTRTNLTGVAAAFDACGSVTVTYSDVVSNSCGGTKTVWRNWTAMDQCGNSTNAVQTITVRDTTPPALKLPADLVLNCPADTRTSATGVATAPDACGSVTITYSDSVSTGCGETKVVSRLWTATDECGNSTNGLQTITVQDTTKPTIVCRAISVQCAGDVPTAYADLAAFLAAGNTASDSCDATLTFSLVSESALTGSCPARMTRVYRVTDDCGNYADGTQTITVDDTIAPALTCLPNTTVECGVSLDPANLGNVTATDNCDTNVAITYTDAAVGSQYSLRFYSADSDVDSGPYAPTYLKLAPASLPCPSEAQATGRATDPLRRAVAYGPTGDTLDALTALNGGSMSLGQVVPFEIVIEASGAPGPEHGTIDFTADWATHTTSNDRFGYDTNYMIYCAFVDYADPGTVDPHYNARVESYQSALSNQGTIDEQIRGTFRISGLDPGDRVVVEVWVVLDATPPRSGGTIAANLVSAQKATLPPEAISTGVQTVGIGNLNKLNPLPAPQPQPALGPLPPQPPVPPGRLVSVINRTWAATDACGNRGTCVQQITIWDAAPPALVAPADLVLEYPADTSTNNTGVAVAPDACGSTTITYSDVVTNGCGDTKTIWRTWAATDGYNSTNCVQTIIVRDRTPPTLAMPADAVLECPADTSTAQNGTATASDASGSATVTYSDSISAGCGGTKVVSRLWTATDVCGNSTNSVQTITVQDTTPPALTVPANLVLECPADTGTNNTGVATAADGCSKVAISYADAITAGSGGTRVIVRTWTATDQCGNISKGVQTLTVEDTTPPAISYKVAQTFGPGDYASKGDLDETLQNKFTSVFPSGLVIGLADPDNAIPGATSLLWEANATGTTALSALLAQAGGTSGPITQDAVNPTGTFGGGTLALQTIALSLNVGFNQAGVLGAGPNNLSSLIYANAGDSLNGMTVTQILAAANKALAGQGLPSGYDFNSLAALIESLNLSFRTYAASAWAASHLTPPTLAVECPSELPPPDPASVTASDTCSAPVTLISLPDAITDYVNPGHYTVLRTWVAIDACGNTNSVSIPILVSDVTAPILTAAPDRTVTEGTEWDFAQPIAADNCGSASVSVLSTATNTASELPGQDAILVTRIWSATDAAGNATTCQQTITVMPPVNPPTIAANPQCQTVGSGSSTTLSVIAAGTGPFTYQWQLNGSNIAGAIGSSLALNKMQLTDAGLYTVVVGNSGGTVTSQAAVVNVLPRLLMQLSDHALQLTWPAGFILQGAGSPAGPYIDVAGATSPYLHDTHANPWQFFRLRSEPVRLIVTPLPDGQNSISSPGVPGYNFIIQVSSDLIHWTNLGISPSPIAVVDPYASPGSQHFYRAIPASTCPASAPTIATQPVSQTAAFGNSATLTVAATGSGPFTYQWQRNGTNIAGATGSSLTLDNLKFADSGSYTVVVTSPAGSVTSEAAVLTVAPVISIARGTQGLTLSWPGDFILQAAPSPAGPYTDVAGAASPHPYNTLTEAQKYFRLRSN